MAEPNPSAVPGDRAVPAIEFAEWLPALGGSRLLRVHGGAAGGATPVLVITTPSGGHRIEPRSQSRFTRAHEWRASYLISSEVAAGGWSATTLEWPDGTRLQLPEPTEPGAQVVDPTVLSSLRARRRAESPPALPSSTFAVRTPESTAPATAASPAGAAPSAADVAAPRVADVAARPAAEVAAPSVAEVAAPPVAEVAPPPVAQVAAPPAAEVAVPPAADIASPPRSDVAAPPVASSRATLAPVAPPRANGASPGARSWADPPGAFSGSVFEAEALWTARRAELERELTRAAEAIARAERGERAAREAVLTALAAMRADLRAAHAARAADADTIATLKAELEAERIAHTVTRRTASDLRAALAQSRRHHPDSLRAALDAERKARAEAENALLETQQVGSVLMQRIAELSRAQELDREALARHAREQARTAAEAERRPQQETGELVANLEAAAAALRARTAKAVAGTDDPPAALADDVEARGLAEPAAPTRAVDAAGLAVPDVPAGAVDAAGLAGPAAPTGAVGPAGLAGPAALAGAVGPAGLADPAATVGAEATPRDLLPAEPTTSDFAALSDALTGHPARPLRRVLVALAERDPISAGEVLAGLLPAQGPVFDKPTAYDLTIAGIGTFAVTVRDGSAAVERVSRPRGRGEALFELSSDSRTLAELLAGDGRRIGRFRGPARVSRRRRKARVLEALPQAQISLADALRAGARLEPALVYKVLPLAIDPAWTAGHVFTIAQEITDPDARTWYVAVRDGAEIEVTESAPEAPADATVTMTRAAFERLLRDEPPDPAERPLVRGDRAAVAILKAWTDRARGAA